MGQRKGQHPLASARRGRGGGQGVGFLDRLLQSQNIQTLNSASSEAQIRETAK